MTGLHYPDNLYADHEERKARRAQQPTGAYRAPHEMPEAERKLRTALSYVCHARDLIREALGDNEPSARSLNNEDLARALDKLASTSERVPKWDPRWHKLEVYRAAGVREELALRIVDAAPGEWIGIDEKDVGALRIANAALANAQPPNCDGLKARDIRAPHPMAAEAIRNHDERLSGAEDRL